MMKKFFLLIIILSPLVCGQRVDFFKEDITFRLFNAQFYVEGYYWFANNFDKPVSSSLYYPFPNYSGEKIDSIYLYNISAGQKSGFTWESRNAISFKLYIEPHDTVLLQIGYRQSLTADSAVYILKTTQGWGKPLVNAEYKLLVPQSIKIKKFSYPPDKSYFIENQKIYYWKKDNFMPKRDMIFYF